MPLFRAGRTAVAVAMLGVLATPMFAQKKDDKKDASQTKFTDAQRQELLPVIRTVDEVMKNGTPGTFNVTVGKDPNAPAQLQPTTADVNFTWHNDFLKATNNLIYVPFIVAAEPPKGATGTASATGAASTAATPPAAAGSGAPAAGADASAKVPTSVVAYLRVAPKGSTGAPAPATGGDAKDNKDSGKKDTKDSKDSKDKGPSYPFEDVYFTDLRSAAGQSPRLSRAFSVPAGSYDVYLALRERPAGGGSEKSDAPVKVFVMKQTIDIPNYWSGDFQTSSVIVAEKVEPLSAPLPPESQRERPYVLGSTEIVPTTDNKFKKTQELGIIFQIYGAKLGSDKKPDVTIEYNFMTRSSDGSEKPFNKTPPQQMNAQTLPANFDPDAGYQLVGGQTIPLTSFPEGDYRLEIKVTDNKATKSLTRDVLFSVTPAS